MELSGSTALVIKACKGAKVTVKGSFSNEGFELVKLSEEERSEMSSVPEYLKIRGYKFVGHDVQVYEFNEPANILLRINH